ncbi:MAG: hypothetical protein OXU75_05605 [Deltaproteobacteria bacterium]|nr:hypothetical protein [Deltaproteobacteria bacterium]
MERQDRVLWTTFAGNSSGEVPRTWDRMCSRRASSNRPGFPMAKLLMDDVTIT